VRSVSGLCRSVSGGAVRPLDALRRRTHLSGRLNSHRLIRHRQDRLVSSGGRCELGIRFFIVQDKVPIRLVAT